eukprot:scaffold17837_cov60-Phaeocystis_antarctica.AAC.1
MSYCDSTCGSVESSSRAFLHASRRRWPPRLLRDTCLGLGLGLGLGVGVEVGVRRLLRVTSILCSVLQCDAKCAHTAASKSAQPSCASPDSDTSCWPGSASTAMRPTLVLAAP